MTINYKKLWKLLIDKGMNKSDLRKASGVSWATITKLSKGENIGVDALAKICATPDYDLGGTEVPFAVLDNAE